MDYVSNNVGVIPALPDIRDILSKDFCENIMNVLVDIPFEIFDDSVCVQRDVSRVPLKLDANSHPRRKSFSANQMMAFDTLNALTFMVITSNRERVC